MRSNGARAGCAGISSPGRADGRKGGGSRDSRTRGLRTRQQGDCPRGRRSISTKTANAPVVIAALIVARIACDGGLLLGASGPDMAARRPIKFSEETACSPIRPEHGTLRSLFLQRAPEHLGQVVAIVSALSSPPGATTVDTARRSGRSLWTEVARGHVCRLWTPNADRLGRGISSNQRTVCRNPASFDNARNSDIDLQTISLHFHVPSSTTGSDPIRPST